MKLTTVYAIIWIVTGIVIISGCYITKSASPIWALLLPLFISLEGRE